MNAQEQLVDAELNLKRAKAAAAEEERERDRAALKAAIARGRELKAEFDTAATQFYAAREEADKLDRLLRALDDRATGLRTQEPYATQDFPSPEDQASWERDTRRVEKERALTLAEAHNTAARREQYRREALRAEAAVQYQSHVVRNLRAKIEDPGQEYMLHGAPGGVFAPLGKRVF